MHGPAALIGQLADAEPLARHLVDHALADRAVHWDWPEHCVAAARLAAEVFTRAPPHTWTRDVDAAAERAGLPIDMLYSAVVERVGGARTRRPVPGGDWLSTIAETTSTAAST